MKVQLNVIGPKLQQLRQKQGMTQDQLAAKCQLLGLDVTRGTLAKIESCVRAVSDHEIPFFARALKSSLESLFPKKLTPLSRKARNPKGTSKNEL